MVVRDHRSQHEVAEQLPLLTDTATVTAVEAMDHNRNDEVERAVARRLRQHGHGEWVIEKHHGVEIDWTQARQFAADHGLEDLQTLADRYERPYPSLMRLRVDPDCDLEFAAGQYVTIRFEETPRPYSVASPPTADELEFCIRRVPGGRLTSDLFEDLQVGDTVAIRGPNGDFVLNDPSGRDVAFLATGTGVAPFHSMIQYLFDTGNDRYEDEPRQIWLFLGCGWEDDLPYREAFRGLADAHDHFHFVPCLTREHLLTDWDGEDDYVQRVFCKYLSPSTSLPRRLRTWRDRAPRRRIDDRLDPSSLEVYACGTNAMVQSLVDVVEQAGVPDRYVAAEGFG